MIAILKKEIRYFFSSLIGPIVLVLFLLTNSLFLWAYAPNEYMNILSSGFASLEPLFALAPWMYLILIPAMTMRAFSEEKANGTIELLLTRPLTEFQIILGKFLAYLILLILTLIPTFIYYYSIEFLSHGNIDQGATIGSYLGLLLLGASFISIGLFASVITKSQIISLLISLLFCLLFYFGFSLIANVGNDTSISYIIQQFGIEEHYYSISRGLIDTRDLTYYFCLIGLFILLTKVTLVSRKW
ncbi:MAG: gliding motility-associated ABC transporter permease subunit GldF [Flavobacteriales bacterium]|nr:gliding motility-associated ABC transporter permease subunit GldF [Flavobacteriales bacterium]MBO72861.1 gliding motility-associated ABC transporter permease subunit GldF [Flavobacteriales bacterium]|tara:strand:+ start:1569 stop:2300 length:732 start_codon:yes stop_codon:yes gene_type:complete